MKSTILLIATIGAILALLALAFISNFRNKQDSYILPQSPAASEQKDEVTPSTAGGGSPRNENYRPAETISDSEGNKGNSGFIGPKGQPSVTGPTAPPPGL